MRSRAEEARGRERKKIFHYESCGWTGKNENERPPEFALRGEGFW